MFNYDYVTEGEPSSGIQIPSGFPVVTGPVIIYLLLIVIYFI